MTAQSTQNIKTIAKISLVVVLLLSIGLFIAQTDFSEVYLSLNRIGWRFIFIILVTFVAFAMGTLSWRYTLPKSSDHIPFAQLFGIRLMGESLGLVNPANVLGGDSFKAYLLKKEGVAYERSISSLIVSRLIMMFSQIGMFIIAAILFLIFIDTNSLLLKILSWTIFGLIVVLALIMIAFKLMKVAGAEHKSTSRFYKYNLSKRISSVFYQVRDFYTGDKKRFYQSIFWSMMNWLIGSLEILLIFYFVGVPISMLDALLVDQGVLVLKSLGAFIPGQIGVEEYANKVMLAFVGLTSASLWITVSILRRSRQIFWITLSMVLYFVYKYANSKKNIDVATKNSPPNLKMVES